MLKIQQNVNKMKIDGVTWMGSIKASKSYNSKIILL